MLAKKILSSTVFNQIVRKQVPRVQLEWSAFYSNSMFVKAIEDAENKVGYHYDVNVNQKNEYIDSVIFDRKYFFSNTVKRLDHETFGKQVSGLITLLVSKATGQSKAWSQLSDKEKSNGISESQRQLANVIDSIYSAQLWHRNVVDYKTCMTDLKFGKSDIQHENKLSLLKGDFMLASAWENLSKLKNIRTMEMISESLSHMIEGLFIDSIEFDSKKILKFWKKRNFLTSGSLHASSCGAAIALSNADLELQKKGYEFGKNFSLAYQALLEMQPCLDAYKPNSDHVMLYLMSAPVLFHSHLTGQSLLEIADKYKSFENNFVDYNKIYKHLEMKAIVEKTEELKNYFANRAMSIISSFPVREGVEPIKNILAAMTNTQISVK